MSAALGAGPAVLTRRRRLAACARHVAIPARDAPNTARALASDVAVAHRDARDLAIVTDMWRTVAGIGAVDDTSGATRRAAVARPLAHDMATRAAIRSAVRSVLTADPAIVIASRTAVAVEPSTADVARPGAANLIAGAARVAARKAGAAGPIVRIARHEGKHAQEDRGCTQNERGHASEAHRAPA
jgi:hypothetical protein